MGNRRRKTRSADIRSPQKRQGKSYLSGLPVHILLTTGFTAIVFLVVAELALGWTFDTAEISLIVLVVLVIMAFKFIARA